MYTKVEGSIVRNRIPEFGEIGINRCNYPSGAINVTSKVVGKLHIKIRVDVHKKDGGVLLTPECDVDSRLKTPELFLSLIYEKSVREEEVAMDDSGCGLCLKAY